MAEPPDYASFDRSSSLARTAAGRIPGGVNSPVRAFKAVGGEPLFIERASGCRLIDAENDTPQCFSGRCNP